MDDMKKKNRRSEEAAKRLSRRVRNSSGIANLPAPALLSADNASGNPPPVRRTGGMNAGFAGEAAKADL
jgi:hypothetical protein